jgi:hypothetical protein
VARPSLATSPSGCATYYFVAVALAWLHRLFRSSGYHLSGACEFLRGKCYEGVSWHEPLHRFTVHRWLWWCAFANPTKPKRVLIEWFRPACLTGLLEITHCPHFLDCKIAGENTRTDGYRPISRYTL